MKDEYMILVVGGDHDPVMDYPEANRIAAPITQKLRKVVDYFDPEVVHLGPASMPVQRAVNDMKLQRKGEIIPYDEDAMYHLVLAVSPMQPEAKKVVDEAIDSGVTRVIHMKQSE